MVLGVLIALDGCASVDVCVFSATSGLVLVSLTHCAYVVVRKASRVCSLAYVLPTRAPPNLQTLKGAVVV